jgi:hypothetical protein
MDIFSVSATCGLKQVKTVSEGSLFVTQPPWMHNLLEQGIGMQKERGGYDHREGNAACCSEESIQN